MKQGTRFGGRNNPFVSCEVLLSSHKVLIEIGQIHFPVVFFINYVSNLVCLFGHFCATCLDYAQYN